MVEGAKELTAWGRTKLTKEAEGDILDEATTI